MSSRARSRASSPSSPSSISSTGTTFLRYPCILSGEATTIAAAAAAAASAVDPPCPSGSSMSMVDDEAPDLLDCPSLSVSSQSSSCKVLKVPRFNLSIFFFGNNRILSVKRDLFETQTKRVTATTGTRSLIFLGVFWRNKMASGLHPRHPCHLSQDTTGASRPRCIRWTTRLDKQRDFHVELVRLNRLELEVPAGLNSLQIIQQTMGFTMQE